MATRPKRSRHGRGMHWALFAVLAALGLGLAVASIIVFYGGVLEGGNLETKATAVPFSSLLLVAGIVLLVTLVSLLGGRHEGEIRLGRRFGFWWSHDSRTLDEAADAHEKRTAELKKTPKQAKRSLDG